jgi:hypothetical protein
MKLSALALLALTSCAQLEEQAKAPAIVKGACAYSWSLGGTWITWCYQDDTQSGCDARETATTLAVYFSGKTCPESGYPLRCASGAYKNSACAWYE